jgi:tetratricopeptide (TPR) repeat protein
LPGKLIERPWVNFGHNRSEAFNYAKEFGDWILTIDADMVVNIEVWAFNNLDESLDAYYILQQNGNLNYFNLRLFNSKSNWAFTLLDGSPKTSRFIRSVEICDIGDGGSKVDKFQRDIRLLTDDLLNDPNNSRTLFYLGQSLFDIGEYDQAIKYYDKCYNISTWEEEKWYCLYKLGQIAIHTNQDHTKVNQFMLTAWLERPSRIEPVFELAMYYKQRNEWEKVYRLLLICEQTGYPKDDILFIVSDYYEYARLHDELSLATYWTSRYKESFKHVHSVASSGSYYKNHKERIDTNFRIINEKYLELGINK